MEECRSVLQILSLTKILFSTPIFRRGLGPYTLGTRDFFSRVMRSLVSRRPILLWSSAEDKSGKKPLAQSAYIYRARWTLTLSLICQSNWRSQDC